MRVLIASVHVPFARGGAELLAEGLRDVLHAEGHEAEIIALPFQWIPAERILDQMLAWRLMDVTHSNMIPVDLVIGLKFPAYLLNHPNKVLWILHQHRQAYDLRDSIHDRFSHDPNGGLLRNAVVEADRRFIPDARKVFTIADTVSRRLKAYCGIDSVPLYHPPPRAERFTCAPATDYLFFPSRITSRKRQKLVVEALAQTRRPVQVYFVGPPESPTYQAEIEVLVRKHRLDSRIRWLGAVSDEDLRSLYARSLAVIYPPENEDYGYVTLEAMLSSKAVLTCTDSGGPLEFVQDSETGQVAEPTPASLAAAMDGLWQDRDKARHWGRAARALYNSLDISWHNVARRLLACA
jgi:glycosyltransferase involved in cell wall biosynthesis